MDPELGISNQTPTVLIYEKNQLKNNSEKNQNKKIKLGLEAQLSMTTMLATLGLIPFIPVIGFLVISCSVLISMLCYINWEVSEKHTNN